MKASLRLRVLGDPVHRPADALLFGTVRTTKHAFAGLDAVSDYARAAVVANWRQGVNLHRDLNQKWSILASKTVPSVAPEIFENVHKSLA